jgi:hypothetical protein
MKQLSSPQPQDSRRVRDFYLEEMSQNLWPCFRISLVLLCLTDQLLYVCRNVCVYLFVCFSF